MYSQIESPIGLVYYSTPWSKLEVRSHRIQRVHFWQFLRLSVVSLCYHSDVVRKTDLGVRFVPQRYFESLAAGCLVFGTMPPRQPGIEKISWEDSVVELPPDDKDVIACIRSLLADADRLELIRKRNYRNSLALNDWRHRLNEIMSILSINSKQATESVRRVQLVVDKLSRTDLRPH